MFDKSNIKVYSYTSCFFAVTAKNREISFAPSTDGVPTMELLSFEEVEYINSHSNVFRVGRIEFEDDLKEELFAALKINTSDCLYERDIDALISAFTLENAQRILSIKDIGTIERVRGHVVMHQNRADIDVPTRMVTLVNERYREVSAGKIKTEIRIREGNDEPSTPSVSMDEVQKLLDKQREEIMAAVAAAQKPVEIAGYAVAAGIEIPDAAITVASSKPTQEPPAKRGRPAGTSKSTGKNASKK